jgi:ketosteroid isomerase-like protein
MGKYLRVAAGFFLLFFAILAGIKAGSLRAAQDPEAEKAAVAKVIRASIEWALTKDLELQKATMAQDEDLFYFWINSNFVVRGWKQHTGLFATWMDPRFKATHTEVRDLSIHLSRSGDVAWYSALLDDLGEWDGKELGDRDIQWTGVLEKRDGKWKIVQMHASLPADKVREKALEEKKRP